MSKWPKLSEFNAKSLQANLADPKLRQPAGAAVLCDNCETEMLILAWCNYYGYELVVCPGCGYQAYKFLEK